ncbi:TPA: TerC family protein [Pseudomonas aeruginosa]|nr:TerC family protein [Pseudomonas aeruginosa]EKU4048756.1 TerC family protein [Pseudomonas aeruginosa]EKX7952973.1 TerC family protein [Pseudomonas aeruginosa]EKX9334310.1 TerC family protein [Pseudomonas aeruginosa]
MIHWLSDPTFWTALLQIVAIDILLGGDNAVVIALACRHLPAHRRKQAIFGGVAGAILIRILLLFFALHLLDLPYLKVIGALLLLWIGIKLLLPEEEDGDDIKGTTHLLGAIKTIIIADAVMSLDNVIALSAASAGDFFLVSLGVLISIPIIVWGSQLILRLIDRFPLIILFGGGLLGWIAGGMLLTDSALKPWLAPYAQWDSYLHYGAAAFGALFVILLGSLLARRQLKQRHAAPTAAAESEGR